MSKPRKKTQTSGDSHEWEDFVRNRAKHLHECFAKADQLFIDDLEPINGIDENKPENALTIMYTTKAALLMCLQRRLKASCRYNIECSELFYDPQSSFIDLEDINCRLRLKASEAAFSICRANLTASGRVSLFDAAVMLGKELGSQVQFMFAAPELFASAILAKEIDPMHEDTHIALSRNSIKSPMQVDMNWLITRDNLFTWSRSKWPDHSFEWLQANIKQNPDSSPHESSHNKKGEALENRIAAILRELSKSGVSDLQKLPVSIKSAMRAALIEREPRLFTESTFNQAWSESSKRGLFRTLNRDMYCNGKRSFNG